LGTSVWRLTDRRLSRPALRHPRLWSAIAVATLIASLGVYVSLSSAFHLRHLEVEGNSHLTRRTVLELSGLTRRTNLLWLDAGSVERRLEADPWVAGATVSKEFPRTVRIQVTERTPVATVAGYGGYQLIAADGTSLGVVSSRPHLPLIVVPPTRAIHGRAPDPGASARAVAGLDPKLRARVQSVVVEMDGCLVLHLTNGVRVEYGAPSQTVAKSRVIASVLRWASAHARSVLTVNVSAPGAPAASFAP
jgi:cell division protein FtsQ